MDSKDECVQLNLAHVARKNILKNEETKTNKRQCPLSSVRVQDIHSDTNIIVGMRLRLGSDAGDS